VLHPIHTRLGHVPRRQTGTHDACLFNNAPSADVPRAERWSTTLPLCLQPRSSLTCAARPSESARLMWSCSLTMSVKMVSSPPCYLSLSLSSLSRSLSLARAHTISLSTLSLQHLPCARGKGEGCRGGDLLDNGEREREREKREREKREREKRERERRPSFRFRFRVRDVGCRVQGAGR
jgi:hypothetical protein